MDLEINVFHHALSLLLLTKSKVLHHWKQQRGRDHLKTLMCLLFICGGAAVGNINEALKDKTHPCSSRSPCVTPGPLPSPPQAACLWSGLWRRWWRLDRLTHTEEADSWLYIPLSLIFSSSIHLFLLSSVSPYLLIFFPDDFLAGEHAEPRIWVSWEGFYHFCISIFCRGLVKLVHSHEESTVGD